MVLLWECRILWGGGGQLSGLNLSFPGITPVAVSQLHQGQVTPGSHSLVLYHSAGREGNAALWFQAVIPAQAVLAQ